MDGQREVGQFPPASLRHEVLSQVAPNAEERARVAKSAEMLVKAVNEAMISMGVEGVEPVIAGSVAKGTFSKDPDMDVFLLFPSTTPKDELEKVGLAIGEKVLKDPVKRYTQHPYLTGRFEGLTCDIVPCLRISKGERVQSAVDRSVHHVDHINAKLRPELREDVLLLKAFLRGIGSYGAEDTVNGFSGYLAELLIIAFNGFCGAIKALSSIQTTCDPPISSEELSDRVWIAAAPVVIDLDAGRLVFGTPSDIRNANDLLREPLVAIDPVDKRRNVASPVSAQTLAHTVRFARALMERPSKELFHPFTPRPFHIPGRDYAPLDGAIPSSQFILRLPDGNSDIVATQLRRVLRACCASLRRSGFDSVVARYCIMFPSHEKMDQGYVKTRWAFRADLVRSPILMVQLRTEPEALPPDLLHWGPPSDNPMAPDFLGKWGNHARMDPESGRLFTIIRRDRTDPGSLFTAAWSEHARGLFQGSELVVPTDENLIELMRDIMTR